MLMRLIRMVFKSFEPECFKFFQFIQWKISPRGDMRVEEDVGVWLVGVFEQLHHS